MKRIALFLSLLATPLLALDPPPTVGKFAPGAKYAEPRIAHRNLETLLAATLEATLLDVNEAACELTRRRKRALLAAHVERDTVTKLAGGAFDFGVADVASVTTARARQRRAGDRRHLDRDEQDQCDRGDSPGAHHRAIACISPRSP